jgi:hypothetical protein
MKTVTTEPKGTPASRRPHGYVGTDHETIGSDILAVLGALRAPDAVLGAATLARVKLVESNRWYPIAWLLELMDELDRNVGRFALLRLGRKIFELSHKEQATRTARSARDIIYAFDAMYHNANRGTAIGGWKVLHFSPGRAELEKTTPHHCTMEEGILLEALAAMKVPAVVEQTACFRKGAPSCIYVATSAVVDRRWNGDDDPTSQDPHP